jgi:hypothetical protein
LPCVDEKLPNFTLAELDKIHPNIARMDDHFQQTESQNQVRYEDMAVEIQDEGNPVFLTYLYVRTPSKLWKQCEKGFKE